MRLIGFVQGFDGRVACRTFCIDSACIRRLATIRSSIAVPYNPASSPGNGIAKLIPKRNPKTCV